MKHNIAPLTLVAAVVASAIIAAAQDEFSFFLIVLCQVVVTFLLAWLISQPRRRFPSPTPAQSKYRPPLAIEIIDKLPMD